MFCALAIFTLGEFMDDANQFRSGHVSQGFAAPVNDFTHFTTSPPLTSISPMPTHRLCVSHRPFRSRSMNAVG